ncbi:MAG: aldolase/citrate lyase family protein, partial [Acidobacteriota bacterium]|nr:aldolase/citrate lyase family protein [Acidobacteriota bacterium]
MTFAENELRDLFTGVQPANQAYAVEFPGDSGARQPVHTVYGGAHLFRADTAQSLGRLALRSLAEFGGGPDEFAKALGVPDSIAQSVHARVKQKLEREPVEDFRIDFEDGYGNRSDPEEDHHAIQAATEVAQGAIAKLLSPFIGIRIKPLTEALHARSVRTLDLFLTTLVEKIDGPLPGGFVITLPKITSPEQVTALVVLLERFEAAHRLRPGSLLIELMIETTQSIFDAEGRVAIPKLVRAARGRCRGAHFGVYDYTAACEITADHQSMVHPACDFARDVMQVSLAGRGVMLSDGATNVMPIAPHRGDTPNETQTDENQRMVHRAWKLHFDQVQRSLQRGFYQGWDLHPAQLPTRYAAVFAFFQQSLGSA